MITYKEVLQKIENQQNHLLIANGFNRGLGVNTSYSAIFEKMIESKIIYKEAQPLFVACGYDLEVFLGKLESNIENNPFLKKYISNNVKLDFMQATHEIVKSKIKNIYAEKNEGIFLLLRNFTNYFTLNYDSFIYLLLLKYKPLNNNENNAIVFEPSIKFIEADLDLTANNIYGEIKKARESGILRITIGNDLNFLEESFSKLKKSHFFTEIKAYSKANNKGWSELDVKKVIDIIFKEEQKNQILKKVDDGSVMQMSLFNDESEFVFVNKDTQNLFFLHGAFHIYKDGHKHKKITQESDKALYDKLEDILNSEEKDIVCVFKHVNKMDVIENNDYLQNCLNKLEKISGNIVIIGSSLADNDKHIFTRINNSDVDTVYVSSLKCTESNILESAKLMFPDKDICLFDAETISYEIPEAIN